jgi:hypothetical protein
MVGIIVAHLYIVYAFRFCMGIGLTYMAGELGVPVFVSGVSFCAESTDRAIISLAGCLVVPKLLAGLALVCWVGGVVVHSLVRCIVNIDMGSFKLISFSVAVDSYDNAGYSFPSSFVGV